MAAIPFIYYLLALYSSWRFFRDSRSARPAPSSFTPPVSNLKPVRGLDPDAYENFASFCRQDYPEYEIVFCLGDRNDPALRVIEQLTRDFPGRSIRVLFSAGSTASNDKVAKLVRLAAEARYEHLVISDSDGRVGPDYLRTIIAPLADPQVGAVTCLYVPAGEKTFAERLQTTGMLSDFYAGIMVARQLDGVKFAFGATIATTRASLAEFGGYQALENRPADDLLVGRLIAGHGHKVELLPYAVQTVPDFQSMRGLFQKRLRWMVVMRHMRPWGHLGLIFTFGLPWALAAVAFHPTLAVALGYLGGYLALRIAMTWMIASWGLKQSGVAKRIPLIPLWDAVAFFVWLASFLRKRLRWRDVEFYIRDGMLVPVTSSPAAKQAPAPGLLSDS
jgi:ceramide glucosyltransferase